MKARIVPERVVAGRANLNWSQKELADEVGVTQQAINAIESGQVARPTKLREIAQALGLDEDYLLGLTDVAWRGVDDLPGGDGKPFEVMGTPLQRREDGSPVYVPLDQFENDESPPDDVRLVGYVGAGQEAHYYALADEELDRVPAPDGRTPDTVAVEIRGSSLGTLFDRWLVYYDDVRTPVTSDQIGALCVVGLPNDKVLIKKLRRSKLGDGLYDLLSNTEDPMVGEPVMWAAKVKSMVPR